MVNFFNKRVKKNLEWQNLSLEPTGSKDFGPCECCGNMSRTIWGFVIAPNNESIAAYFVQWTTNNSDHGANFDLILGEWGESAKVENRNAVSLVYKVLNHQGSFMVIDSHERPFAKDNELVSNFLLREQIIGSPIAKEVFTVVDSVFAFEPRIQEIREWQ